jgi:hypothetical protein
MQKNNPFYPDCKWREQGALLVLVFDSRFRPCYLIRMPRKARLAEG